MSSKFPQQVFVKLPLSHVNLIRPIGSSFFFRAMRLKLESTSFHITISKWDDVKECIKQGVDLKEIYAVLSTFAQEREHFEILKRIVSK